jgi:hypothetical protein
MPMKFSTVAINAPNPCLECGEHCKRPKRFCCDAHKEQWLAGRGVTYDQRGIAQVTDERRFRVIAPEALDWRRKLSVSRPF